jgi:hypothetical protein
MEAVIPVSRKAATAPTENCDHFAKPLSERCHF